jgi:GNAT superfamily N-acetyltransferase
LTVGDPGLKLVIAGRDRDMQVNGSGHKAIVTGGAVAMRHQEAEIVARNLAVKLVRPTLDGVPDVPLPVPFRLRWYQPGDAAAWVVIHRRADAYHAASEALFEREFGDPSASELADRQCYVFDAADRPVGTITAWFDVTDRDLGRIHWLAVVPACQRHGIGRALLAAACRRLVRLGHSSAYLMTSTARIAAIRLYLGFGFVPEPRSTAEQQVWEALLACLVDD